MSRTVPAVLPQTAASPAALLEQLIGLLESTKADDGSQAPLALRDRGLDDPTIALLDGWISVAVVTGFYLDRIAAEGYLRTAVEPGSILALADLTGHRPRPGLAADVQLVYKLNPDPADKAISLPAGMLSQSVPGPGEKPQIFETAETLIARPSWNTLALKRSTPLTVTDPSALAQIVVAGAAVKLSANDVILLDLAAQQPPAVLRVASATANQAAATTTIALQVASPARREETKLAADEDPPATAAPPASPAPPAPCSLLETLDGLVAGLAGPRATVPRPAPSRSPAAVFAPTSDAMPRVLAALHPELGPTLYQALATTGRDQTQVRGASVLRVKTIPFGAQIPPRTLHDNKGQPSGREELPIADTQILELAFHGLAYPPDPQRDLFAGLDAIGVTAKTATATGADTAVENPRRHWRADLAPLGTLDLELDVIAPSQQERSQMSGFTASYEGSGAADPTTVITATPRPGGAFELEIRDADGNSERYIWDSQTTTPLRLNLGFWRLSIAWLLGLPPSSTPPAGRRPASPARQPADPKLAAAERIAAVRLGADPGLEVDPTLGAQAGQPSRATLTITLETPLPVSDPRVLELDGRFDAILPGTRVLIESALVPAPPPAPVPGAVPGAGTGTGTGTGPSGDAADGGGDGADGSGAAVASRYPLITTVTAAASAVVTRHGRTAQSTVLTLADHWIGQERLLSALRTLTVRAHPEPLTVAPMPVTSDLAGEQIELDTLLAGIDAGRPLIVTGTRTNLPNGASAPAGEIVRIAAVTHARTAGVEGDALHTTLTVTPPLANSYARASVAIYGNVVRAHQGATTTEVLGSGAPAQARPTFTLSSAPVLAEPAPTATGAASTLAVTVDGVAYAEAPRIDAGTPPRSFVTGADAQGHTTITFADALPTGTDNVAATYRAGDGAAGNVRPHQVTQLLSKPLGVAAVDNPLPGSGGSPADGPEQLRANAATGLRSLGRVVSIADCADLARAWAGIADASSVLTTNGRRQVLLVTIAGTAAVRLDPKGALCTALAAALAAATDPTTPVVVAPAELLMIVLGASVTPDPAFVWEAVASGVRAALLASFGYARRSLGQDVLTSALIAAAHTAPGVLAFRVDSLALISASSTSSDLAALPAQLAATVPPRTTVKPGGQAASAPAVPGGPLSGLQPAQIAFLSDAVPDTLILRRHLP